MAGADEYVELEDVQVVERLCALFPHSESSRFNGQIDNYSFILLSI